MVKLSNKINILITVIFTIYEAFEALKLWKHCIEVVINEAIEGEGNAVNYHFILSLLAVLVYNTLLCCYLDSCCLLWVFGYNSTNHLSGLPLQT